MTFKETVCTQTIAGKAITIKTGVMAKQANGAVVVQCGNAVLLATAVMSKEPKEGIDFLPLTIEYAEKMYASGKIPGGFFKREARPSTLATLTARLIDRPLRPTFPKHFHNDIQIIITVLSYDPDIQMEPLAIVAASAALSVSDIPFNGPIGSVIVGQIDGKLIVNPSPKDNEKSTLTIVVAGTADAILMVESESKEVSEDTIIEAIMLGHEAIKETITLQKDLQNQTGKTKQEVKARDPRVETLTTEINSFLGSTIAENLMKGDKKETETFLSNLKKDAIEKFSTSDNDQDLIGQVFDSVKKDSIRKVIIDQKVRPDGRKTDEIRPIDIQVGVLPSVHGSALFTRGETQSLGVVTLGTSNDEQLIDGLDDTKKSNYFFHYNFPPYSVGETGRLATSRRELGHGALAERALKAILPDFEKFPYTLRIVSEILESNGSSSMASVCSGALSLMDCGVPIKAPVSGIAMGLLMDGDDYIILSDIQGLEDHYGDMDFKVAGTEKGITALQLDIKVSGLSKEILVKSLQQAKEGRLFILNKMTSTISSPRTELSENAPKIHTMFIDPDKVGLIIGPGGKMIRKIEEESEASVIVKDGSKGEVCIAAKHGKSMEIAVNMINGLVKEPEVGEVYNGKVVKTVAFGAFVEILPGKEGLIHISKLSNERVNKVEDVVSVGDEISVKINQVDAQNRINLVRATDEG